MKHKSKEKPCSHSVIYWFYNVNGSEKKCNENSFAVAESISGLNLRECSNIA